VIEQTKNRLNQLLFPKSFQQVEVFVRYCHFSDVSSHKKRPSQFSRQSCYQNLLKTIEEVAKVNVTFFLDTYFPMKERHFILDQDRFPVIQMKQGTEAGSFCFMLDYVLSQKLSADTIVYFLEDDYVHRFGWVDVLREGISISGIDYVTLYDHKDKYFFSQYQGLQTELFLTKNSHWRLTPSTTNTYAMKFATLKRDKELHYTFSRREKISRDHDKFCALSSQGSKLVSAIPGWSTHMEPEYLSPCIDWKMVQLESTLCNK
jgi:hypothetical protein